METILRDINYNKQFSNYLVFSGQKNQFFSVVSCSIYFIFSFDTLVSTANAHLTFQKISTNFREEIEPTQKL